MFYETGYRVGDAPVEMQVNDKEMKEERHMHGKKNLLRSRHPLRRPVLVQT